MGSRIEVRQPGGVEALVSVPVEVLEPGDGQVWLEHEAIGVNYLDVMQRMGTAPLALPNGLGIEAAGRVVRVGPNVSNVQVGDRVGYVLGAPGSYSTGRLYPADRLIPLPAALSFEAAAAVLMKGITAQYLLTSTYQVRAGTNVVLYGAAGALGQIMVPWAKALGANVIGVVSRDSSMQRAMQCGCDAVLLWGRHDIPAEVARITAGRKADVVYDGVGKQTFGASLDCLAPRGLMASIGASSGAPPAVEVSTLNAKGSLYLTRPSLAAHATDLSEYQQRAKQVLLAIERQIITPAVWKTFPLDDVRAAHQAMEQGANEGAIVLQP